MVQCSFIVIGEPGNLFRKGVRAMKITSFNPMILTSDVERVIGVFEALGFEKRHAPVVETPDENITITRLKNPEGFYVDVAKLEDIKQDKTVIRMNVDNFEEAYEMLLEHGFRNYKGDMALYTETSKTALLVAPNGFVIGLVKHIKWKL